MDVTGAGQGRRPRWGRPGLEGDRRAREPEDERPELLGLEAPIDAENGDLPLIQRLGQGPRLRRLERPHPDPKVLLRGVHCSGHVRMIGWIGRPGPAGDSHRPDRLQHLGAALDHRVRHSRILVPSGQGIEGIAGRAAIRPPRCPSGISTASACWPRLGTASCCGVACLDLWLGFRVGKSLVGIWRAER